MEDIWLLSGFPKEQLQIAKHLTLSQIPDKYDENEIILTPFCKTSILAHPG
jgi:hypothetical protein